MYPQWNAIGYDSENKFVKQVTNCQNGLKMCIYVLL